MIEINKLNGCIKILEFWIEPYDNIEKIKKIFKKSDFFDNKYIYVDNSNEIEYIFSLNNENNIYLVEIEPYYLSWNDIGNRKDWGILKIKKIFLENNFCIKNEFSWGKVSYQYDNKNLIPSICIEYKK